MHDPAPSTSAASLDDAVALLKQTLREIMTHDLNFGRTIPADEHDLSDDITLHFECRYELPPVRYYPPFADPTREIEQAKSFMLDFDPVPAFMITDRLVVDPRCSDMLDELIVFNYAALGLIYQRNMIRRAQLDRNWVGVLELLRIGEEVLRSRSSGRIRTIFLGYRVPKARYVWAIESYIYLGNHQQAESLFDLLAQRFELKAAERLWIMGNIAYCMGDVETASSLFSDLLKIRDTKMIRVLLRRTLLVQKLVQCFEKGYPAGQKAAFIDIQERFSAWTGDNHYERAILRRISRTLLPKTVPVEQNEVANASHPQHCPSPTTSSRRISLVGNSGDSVLSPRERLVRLLRRAPRGHVDGLDISCETELELSLLEMEALD